MKKGSKSKPKKDKKVPKPPRPRATKKCEELARVMFEPTEEEYRGMGYYVQADTALLDLPYVGINDINREPIQNEIQPSTSQPEFPSLFRSLPLHNQSGKLVLRGYFNEDDALCFQSMYPSNDEQLILWFFQYLAFKDLNSDHHWMISCLVPKYGDV
ncbi:unnamed protein product [Chrysodeixis includens]|uniref:Uncharacterized protein n=1 Tax=Chrysodeixis includens TaxID=689277 RepID=A0A9P0BL10_CHRIL|nr:unnamed protein product [Chrysodeixis includens]